MVERLVAPAGTVFLATLCAVSGRDALTVVIGCVGAAVGLAWLSWQVRREQHRSE